MNLKKQEQLKSYRSKMLESRQQTLDFFAGIEYRYQSRGFINDCEIINDSKASDIESTLYSLEITQTPVHLILGNANVDNVLIHLEKQIRLKVVSLGIYGDVNHALNAELIALVDRAHYSQKLDDVVKNTLNWVKTGETLLFSPASPCFEIYDDYKQRGMHFDKIVEHLIKN